MARCEALDVWASMARYSPLGVCFKVARFCQLGVLAYNGTLIGLGCLADHGIALPVGNVSWEIARLRDDDRRNDRQILLGFEHQVMECPYQSIKAIW